MMQPRADSANPAPPAVPWYWHTPAAFILGWWLYDLQYQWRALVDYQYGWMVVMLSAYLAWERHATRPREDQPASLWTSGLLIAAGTPLLLFAELYKWGVARTPAASFVLSVSCGLFLSAILMQTPGRRAWRHFLFPLLFLFVAVPLPQTIWSPVVNGLRDFVTLLDVEALKLLGIPAVQQGNVIRLPRCEVGVDEACSGVRSLQSSIMAALFIGDLVLRRFGLRLLFLLAGIGFALLGNFIRSLYLSITAHQHGPQALQNAHDAAGWSILVFTATGLILAAWVITRVEKRLAVPAIKTDPRGENARLDKPSGPPLV